LIKNAFVAASKYDASLRDKRPVILEPSDIRIIVVGPDLVIADEAHKIKDEKAKISNVLNKISTKRRIALTGTV
jgi:superfamily II DNA or RNA helicase